MIMMAMASFHCWAICCFGHFVHQDQVWWLVEILCHIFCLTKLKASRKFSKKLELFCLTIIFCPEKIKVTATFFVKCLLAYRHTLKHTFTNDMLTSLKYFLTSPFLNQNLSGVCIISVKHVWSSQPAGTGKQKAAFFCHLFSRQIIKHFGFLSDHFSHSWLYFSFDPLFQRSKWDQPIAKPPSSDCRDQAFHTVPQLFIACPGHPWTRWKLLGNLGNKFKQNLLEIDV